MMQRSVSLFATALFVMLTTLAMCLFTVDQRQYAIVFQLGEVT